MTEAVFDFKSIARKLNRQEQKAEFEDKNPEPAMYGWPYGVAVPLAEPVTSIEVPNSTVHLVASLTFTSKNSSPGEIVNCNIFDVPSGIWSFGIGEDGVPYAQDDAGRVVSGVKI